MIRAHLILSVFLLLTAPAAMHAQLDPLSHQAPTNSPLTQPSLSPGVLQLMQLDAEFSRATLAGGGKAFASWFADDALALNNGKTPVFGKTGGQMGPSGDMGFTWGHYDGHAKDRNGNDIATGGRYITVWKRTPGGKWKVALDASANEPPTDCCAVAKP